MRLALLGCDEAWQAFLRDLPAKHQLVAVYEAAEHELPLNALLPGVERHEQWEALLVRDDIDVVLIASARLLKIQRDGLDPQMRRVDQLKKLAQAGISLLVSHPGAELLDAYEIEMLRREGGGCVLPWFPGLNHPAWQELSGVRIDRVEAAAQISWERRAIGRTRDDVLTALACDLILMERIAGKPKRVTALGGPAASESRHPNWQSLTVQIETADQTVIRWSLAGLSATFTYRVSLSEGETAWELEAPMDLALPWLLRMKAADHDAGEIEWNETTATLNEVERIRSSPADANEAWLEACRSLETLAAVEKSLQRGRTIELSQAEQTEEHAFKGVMASAGCLLLMLTLCALFVVALVEGLQLPLRNSMIWRLWPLALVIPLAGFLGLQFLQTVIKKPENERLRV